VALKHQKSKIKIKQIEYLIFDPYKNTLGRKCIGPGFTESADHVCV
jgi:hypothetical protein